MTLPKTFSLASENFNDFNTMSFETSNTLSSLNARSSQHHEQQLQRQSQNTQQQQQAQHSTHSQSRPMSTSSLPLVQATHAIGGNRSMFNNGLPVSLGFNTDLQAEIVMPGIYLTKNFISSKNDKLRVHRITHIIIIDKHIQELYYPNQQPDIFKLCSNTNSSANRGGSGTRNSTNVAGGLHDDSSSINAFDYYCPPSSSTASALSFDKEFDVIDLNFGENSYLTTVLPNCYKAVKFINKALQSGGTILVIDCNGGEQKCITIIIAYLMYKHNISFSNAFARLKQFYKKADLDRFYISQLYEYEPILQVQRAQSRGHSCSREIHAAILKRKKPLDDDGTIALFDNNNSCNITSANDGGLDNNTTASDLLNNFNPLNRFDTTQMEDRYDIKATNHLPTTFTRFMSGATTGGWYNWDDNAME